MRETSRTLNPRLRSAIAYSSPIPSLAPVTTAHDPCFRRMLGSDAGERNARQMQVSSERRYLLTTTNPTNASAASASCARLYGLCEGGHGRLQVCERRARHGHDRWRAVIGEDRKQADGVGLGVAQKEREREADNVTKGELGSGISRLEGSAGRESPT